MNLSKYSLKFKIILVLFTMPCITWAGSCPIGIRNATTAVVSLGVDPDADPGAILGYRYAEQLGGRYNVICTGSSPYRSTSLLALSTTVEGAYETGIPGVGVKISDFYNPARLVPFSTSLGPNALTNWLAERVRLTFVKTGPIIAGSMGKKVYANYYLNGTIFASVTVPSIRIFQKSCLVDVNTRHQTVILGNHNRSDFNGPGSSAPSSEHNFSVVMNCQKDNIPVLVSFDPVGSSGGNGMITLDAGNDTASGIVVEVLDSSRTPIIFGQTTLYHSLSEALIEIPLIARYKQVGIITPGSANAAMTFTITQN